MEGPFQLSRGVIGAVVGDPRPAVFLLRRVETTPEYAHYRGRVGSTRHGESLAAALIRWVGSDYRVFSFEHVDSPDAAFARECRLWHELSGHTGELDNAGHPRPASSHSGQCPVCVTSARAGAA